jgi:hypothetical protein
VRERERGERGKESDLANFMTGTVPISVCSDEDERRERSADLTFQHEIMKQSKPWEGRRRRGGERVRTEGRWEYEPTFVVLAADGDAGKVHPNWDFFLDHCAERIVFKIFSTHRERERETEM